MMVILGRKNSRKGLKSTQNYPNYSLQIPKSKDTMKGMFYRGSKITEKLLIFLQICRHY